MTTPAVLEASPHTMRASGAPVRRRWSWGPNSDANTLKLSMPTLWSPTRRTESWISALISLAASDERCDSEPTCAATTAKPRPCSPARAASTAALSARMLVWNAISSIVVMMLLILSDESLI